MCMCVCVQMCMCVMCLWVLVHVWYIVHVEVRGYPPGVCPLLSTVGSRDVLVTLRKLPQWTVGGAQGWSTCLTCSRPCIQLPALQQMKKLFHWYLFVVLKTEYLVAQAGLELPYIAEKDLKFLSLIVFYYILYVYISHGNQRTACGSWLSAYSMWDQTQVFRLGGKSLYATEPSLQPWPWISDSSASPPQCWDHRHVPLYRVYVWRLNPGFLVHWTGACTNWAPPAALVWLLSQGLTV